MAPWLRGHFDDAEASFSRMHGISQSQFAANLLVWEAEFEMERGKYARAGELLREARRRQTADSGPEFIDPREARLLCITGQFAAGRKAALAGIRWDGRNVDKLKLHSPMALNAIGDIYLVRGEYSDAVAIFEKSAARAKTKWYIDSPEWIRAENGLALAKLASGDPASAEQLCQQASSAAQREWGSLSIPALDSMDTLGIILFSQSKLSETNAAMAQSQQVRETLYGPEHLKVAESWMHAAMLRAAERDYDGAIKLGNHGLHLHQTILGGINARSALALTCMAEIYARSGRDDEARQCYVNALPILEQEFPDAPPIVQRIRSNIGQAKAPAPHGAGAFACAIVSASLE